ncbi:hypothetical protein QTG54_004426 [Skeletonema marinoi]|uniref:Calmodulin n=1 Tax=Skeletonema marinoi TaxID=267567 RepID=A0AAD8YGQ6_9STRA|nr:hypothetical protein QTG54_004426 [Skeletonema marinoi]
MLPGSPQKGRRRRLINGVKGAFGEKTYTAIQDSSSSRDVRKRMIRSTSSSSSRNNTTVFQPTLDASEEHGYRIDVAKDGSMITAVPIDNDHNPQQRNAATRMGNNNNTATVRRRASPILYSDARVVSTNASINQSLSTHALLDARGNQRQKMKRARPPTTHASDFDMTKPSPEQQHQHQQQKFGHNNNNAAAREKSPIRLARDQLRKAKGLVPTLSGSPKRQEAQTQSSTSKGKRRNSKVTWDLDEPQSTMQQSSNLQKNSTIDDEISFGSFPMLSNHNFGNDAVDKDVKQTKTIQNNDHTKSSTRNEGGDVSFEVSLQRRMEEIESRQAELKKKMTHKDMMKGTLLSAFDHNLEKNRKQMTSLEDELETIRWHLSLEQHEKDKNGSKKILQQKMQDNVANDQAADPMPAFDLESVGDPSITADTDSVADLFGKGKAGQKMKKKGLDPPARPSPSPPTDEESVGDNQSYSLERRDPRGSRVSAKGKSEQRGGVRVKKPTPVHQASTAHGSTFHVSGPREKQIKQTWPSGQALPPRPRKSSAKTVHFSIPRESQDIKFDNDSVDRLSTDFLATNIDDGGGGGDDFSWQGEHFDVDMYDDQSGGLLSSEHHDIYQWKDNKRHVVTSEHYVRENHHHYDLNERQDQRQGFNGSRGVSSASVESDLDLSFVHAVAAVVIQTAVRRFLAELVAEERRYAVQVIQSAALYWMDRRFSQPEPASRTGYAAPMSHHDHIPQSRSPQQRTKRVMFKDEYEDVSNFAATEIQRCFRGWLTRDTLEVDDFAATTIQRVFRGWWMRETMEVDRFCATEIQRIVRGHLCRMNYIYDLYCITVAQSVCRRFLAFNKSAIRLANVLYIQAIYRGYIVRSSLSQYVNEGQEVAATMIQTQWRSYDAQMNYINTLADILIVQSVARRWLTLRRHEVKYWHMSKRKQPAAAAAIYGRKQLVTDSSAGSRNDAHEVWKEHRLKIVAKKKQVHTNEYPEAFSDIFSEDGVEDVRWYDGNTSETNDFLQHWRGRKS